MDTNKLSGIVVYTIHKNDTLREALRKGIEEKFKSESLDESTYGICIQGMLLDYVRKALNSICEKAKTESDSSFSEEDLVCLYYPNSVGKERYIRQLYIINPSNKKE